MIAACADVRFQAGLMQTVLEIGMPTCYMMLQGMSRYKFFVSNYFAPRLCMAMACRHAYVCFLNVRTSKVLFEASVTKRITRPNTGVLAT